MAFTIPRVGLEGSIVVPRGARVEALAALMEFEPAFAKVIVEVPE